MKRRVLVAVTAMALMFTMGFALFGCGGGGSGSIEGSYKFYSMKVAGSEIKADTMEQFGYSMSDFALEIKSGDEFSMTFQGNGTTGTYKVDGSKITLTSNGDLTGTIDGSKITLEVQGIEIVFQK